ncbi:MAG: hypothetical protein AAFQ20_13025 [Bacteroidota bacterium]
MNDVSLGFIGVVLGAIIGSATSILTTFINSKNSLKLQKNLAEQKREDDFRTFQRQTLLSLQDNLVLSLRLTIKAYIEDLEHFKKSGNWGESMLSRDLNNELGSTRRKISILIERLENESLRILLKKHESKGTKSLLSKSPEKNQALIQELTADFGEIMDLVGKELRSYY